MNRTRHPVILKTSAAGLALLLAACAGTGSGNRTSGSSTGTQQGSGAGKAAADEPLLIAPADSGTLTLEETVTQLSNAILKAPAGTAWKPPAAQAGEIRRYRPQLSELVEDADWVLTLSGELEGPRPAGQKAGLRRLHERYAAGAPHAEIAAQVNALLADIEDEHLRRELKKLANRSWERERRGPTPPEKKTAAPGISPEAPDRDTSWTPDRYCAERRAQAARSYADARGATEPAVRDRHLKQSLGYLEDCIRKYPDSPEAEKARQNRARVETVGKDLSP